MRLAIVLAIMTIVYLSAMAFLIRELKAHPSKEDRKMNQSFPIMFGATFLYAVCVIQMLRFFTSGALSLL